MSSQSPILHAFERNLGRMRPILHDRVRRNESLIRSVTLSISPGHLQQKYQKEQKKKKKENANEDYWGLYNGNKLGSVTQMSRLVLLFSLGAGNVSADRVSTASPLHLPTSARIAKSTDHEGGWISISTIMILRVDMQYTAQV